MNLETIMKKHINTALYIAIAACLVLSLLQILTLRAAVRQLEVTLSEVKLTCTSLQARDIELTAMVDASASGLKAENELVRKALARETIRRAESAFGPADTKSIQQDLERELKLIDEMMRSLKENVRP